MTHVQVSRTSFSYVCHGLNGENEVERFFLDMVLCFCQAVTHHQVEVKRPVHRWSIVPPGRVRTLLPPFHEDRPLTMQRAGRTVPAAVEVVAGTAAARRRRLAYERF